MLANWNGAPRWRWLECRRRGEFLLLLVVGAASPLLGAAPTISGQPASITNVASATAVFSATATGTQPLVYQWQRNGLNLAESVRFSGTTSNTLTVASVMPADAGDYRLVVTNDSGAAASEVAMLTVIMPEILTIPDAGLESALRAALSSEPGPLTPSNLTALVSLSACGQGISNLSGLEWATNLMSVSLCQNAISNLTALDGLHGLVHLSLDGNRISDLSPLAGLTNLTSLNLGDNLITNVGALSSLTKLTMLWLHRNPVGSLNPLTNLVSLESLFLFSAGVTDASPLTGLTNLDYLELRWNPLTNAETTLATLTNLTTLYLGGTGISNVTFLQNHSRLSFLNLDHTQVSDLSPLAALPGLRELDAGYNPLTNLATLAAFTNLDSLYLSGSSVSNLDAIVSLGQLRALVLNDNQISDLTPLAGLTNLLQLGLSKNLLTTNAGLETLTNLTSLWLDGTSLSNLVFLQTFRSLKALSFRSSRQTDLTLLAGLTNLVTVFAEQNMLTNITTLVGLDRLSKVQLKGNLLDLSAGSPASATIQTLQSRGAAVAAVPQNAPPEILIPSPVAGGWFTATNTAWNLVFQVTDDFTPGAALLVTASSSDTNLVPNPGILTDVLSDRRTLSITPAPGLTGAAAITLTVTDDAGLKTNVVLTVNVVVPVPVAITDPNLAQVIRWQLGKPTGSLNNLDLSLLTELSADGMTNHSLVGLEWATNLTVLYLRADTITNLAGLPELRNLTSFTLYSDSVTDCSALAGMTNLAHLTLYGRSVTDLGFLPNLQQLTYLSLQVPAVTNFSPLTGLTNLIALELSGNPLGDLAFLAGLSRVTDLTLTRCRVTDVAPLASLTNLLFLDLYLNRLVDIGPLTNLSNLSRLDVRYNLLNTSTSENPPLQTLVWQNVEVSYMPQRGPPIFNAPSFWMAAANTTNSIRCEAYDAGDPTSEPVYVTFLSANTNFAPGTNLLAHRDLPRHPTDWILTEVAPEGFAGTSMLTVTVTNEVGFSSTRTINLTVIVPLPLDSALLGDTNLTWQSGGAAPWFGQSAVTHDGISAAQSGNIGDSAESWIETTFTGPRVLSFWWKISSEHNYDWLELYTNGVLTSSRISGQAGWEKKAVTFPAGTQTVRWRYVKDEGLSDGSDAAWLDEVSLRLPATVSLGNLSQTYNGTAHPVSTTTTPPGLPVSLTYNGSASAPTNAGNYSVTATINTADYYGTTTGTVAIGKAPLAVIAEDKTKGTGQPNPLLTVRYTGFFPGDTSHAVNNPPSAATTATNNSPPGNFPINVTGGSATNYTLLPVPGVLTVTNSPFIILSLTGAGKSNAIITWTSIPFQNYELQYQSIFGGGWLPAGPGITATAWTASATDNSGQASQRYYRVRQLATEAAPGSFSNVPPVILSITGGGTTNSVITWSSISNANYRVLYTSGPGAPWFTLTREIHATDTAASAVDQTDGISQRYYRVMLVVP